MNRSARPRGIGRRSSFAPQRSRPFGLRVTPEPRRRPGPALMLSAARSPIQKIRTNRHNRYDRHEWTGTVGPDVQPASAERRAGPVMAPVTACDMGRELQRTAERDEPLHTPSPGPSLAPLARRIRIIVNEPRIFPDPD